MMAVPNRRASLGRYAVGEEDPGAPVSRAGNLDRHRYARSVHETGEGPNIFPLASSADREKQRSSSSTDPSPVRAIAASDSGINERFGSSALDSWFSRKLGVTVRTGAWPGLAESSCFPAHRVIRAISKLPASATFAFRGESRRSLLWRRRCGFRRQTPLIPVFLFLARNQSFEIFRIELMWLASVSDASLSGGQELPEAVIAISSRSRASNNAG